MKTAFYRSACALIILLSFMGCSSDSPGNQVDLCLGITCQNGGTCNDGSCDCPGNYSGPYCSERVPPTKVTITKIVLSGFPMVDGFGLPWDIGSGIASNPDPFIEIHRGNAVLFVSPIYYNDAVDGNSLEFVMLPNLEISLTSTQHQIYVYDFDTSIGDSDFMCGMNFVPYNTNLPGFPSTVEYNVSETGMHVKIYLSYEW